MNTTTLLHIGGAYHVAWALFDLCWPILWNWKKTLASLDDLQRRLPYLLSRGIAALYLGIAYLSLFRTSDLLSTDIGRDVLIFVSALWLGRLFFQFMYFGFWGKANRQKFERDLYRFPPRRMSNQAFANVFVPIFVLGIVCYVVPLWAVIRS